jgi:hypothetical protein
LADDPNDPFGDAADGLLGRGQLTESPAAAKPGVPPPVPTPPGDLSEPGEIAADAADEAFGGDDSIAGDVTGDEPDDPFNFGDDVSSDTEVDTTTPSGSGGPSGGGGALGAVFRALSRSAAPVADPVVKQGQELLRGARGGAPPPDGPTPTGPDEDPSNQDGFQDVPGPPDAPTEDLLDDADAPLPDDPATDDDPFANEDDPFADDAEPAPTDEDNLPPDDEPATDEEPTP